MRVVAIVILAVELAIGLLCPLFIDDLVAAVVFGAVMLAAVLPGLILAHTGVTHPPQRVILAALAAAHFVAAIWGTTNNGSVLFTALAAGGAAYAFLAVPGTAGTHRAAPPPPRPG